MPTAPVHVIRRRAPSPPVYLLDVVLDRGGRTQAHGALWDGVLNASPEDDLDGPSPVEGLLAGVAGCFVRNLRWVADGRHVDFAQIRLQLAAERDDEPPAISHVRLEADLRTDAPTRRVIEVVESALRTGTITRTVARAAHLQFVLRVNGVPAQVEVPDWGTRKESPEAG
ncbi:MAG: OsmC family protein [Chloroflexota bacterium]